MNWTPLSEINAHTPLSNRLKARIAQTNEAIAQHRQNREAFAAQVQETLATDVQAVAFEDLVGVPVLKTMHAAVLQAELQLRKSIHETYEAILAEWPAVVDRAIEAHEATQREVREALVAIGYLDHPPSSGIVGCIRPGYINEHPRVRQALDDRDACRGLYDGDQAAQRANLAAYEQVRAQLTAARAQAVAI